MMLLRSIPKTNSAPFSIAWRFISRSSTKCSDDVQAPVDGNNEAPTIPRKVVYPKRKLKPLILDEFYEHERASVKERLKEDFDDSMSAIFDRENARQRIPHKAATDILVIGGGVVGTSIAYHLSQKTGPGLKITVVEKDPPALSSSLKVAKNGIYQQLKIKPAAEMAQYAADFYRQLKYTYSDPDLPKFNIDFSPNNSLQLASEKEAMYLEDLSAMYLETGWKHQMLSPSMLKARFPWMNVEGIGAGCLGLQDEGVCDMFQAINAMRAFLRRNEVQFLQGEVIGFEFVDLSDLASMEDKYIKYLSPRRAVIQSPSGEEYRRQFGYVIFAPGSSMRDVFKLIDVNEHIFPIPVETRKCSTFEFWCPDGPGIEMPMVMESNGLKFRKSDLVNKYSVWDDLNCEDWSPNDSEEEPKANNSIFAEKFLPQLIHRVPSFKNAELLSSQAGLIDNCVWDDNIIVGPYPSMFNVLFATGFGNNEFLFAPAVGQGVAELILDREFVNMDLSCFRMERISNHLRLDDASTYL